MTTLIQQVKDKLEETFCPTHIDIRDDSHLHAGHAGVAARGGSHLFLCIVSDLFTDFNTIKRHRLIYTALSQEMDNLNGSGIHALSIQAYTPDEWEQA